MTPSELRRRWRDGAEVALFDAREEFAFAQGHPFFAVSLPPSRVETVAYSLVPRLSAPVVVYDGGIGAAQFVASRLRAMGYSDVSFLEGGLEAYVRDGGELFRDVNVPCKAFGELVETTCHTPSLSADEVHALIAAGADMVVLDVRRFSEYRTMSIPSAVSVPGGEIALRAAPLAPRPETLVVVNCAGRTRSIVGTQSLVNIGLPNRVAALRNGTIGWTLAGHPLDHGQERTFGALDPEARRAAEQGAKRCAEACGVREIGAGELSLFRDESESRTLYCLDVRSAAEYAAGHVAGFVHAPGGQLVQATDEWIAVRGARIVIYSDDAVRAPMTASWLAQMGWDVSVLRPGAVEAIEAGVPAKPRPPLPGPEPRIVSPAALCEMIDAVVLGLAPSPEYRRGHIPGARFLIRSRIPAAVDDLPGGQLILTSGDGALAQYASPELARVTSRSVAVLDGGTAAWVAAGYPLEAGGEGLPPDVYQRPYEGTDVPAKKMQAYIDWELQLVAQMERDGVSGFKVWTGS